MHSQAIFDQVLKLIYNCIMKREEIIGIYKQQMSDLAKIENFLGDESNKLSDEELQRIEFVLNSNAHKVKGLMSLIDGTDRDAREAKETKDELLWEAFLKAEKDKLIPALIVERVLNTKNSDAPSTNEYSISICFDQGNQRVDCDYRLTKNEYYRFRDTCENETEDDFQIKHDGTACTKIQALIPTRRLADQTVLPDIPKRWYLVERFLI